jgi:restriction endonuclease S subunit
MPGEWRTATVQELVDDGILERPIDGNHGEIHPKASDFVERGIPFIMASDLVGGRVDTTHCAFISEEQARSLRKGFARRGDVLISHKATMGRTAFVDQLEAPFLMLTPQVTYYRVKDQSRLSARYLKLYFDSPSFQRLFETWGHKGSTRSYLGITAQLDLPIVLPPPDEQRAIAHILGTLDDKIELNRLMSETLEGIAQAIFKSWFVDFLPVRAKMAAKENDPALLLPQAKPGTWYVYAIECSDGSLYIGQTEDVRQRWLQHVGGKGASWTKTHPPVRVPFWERQPSREAAVERENWLKMGYGRKWLKKEIAARTQTGDPVRLPAEASAQAGAKMEGRWKRGQSLPGLPAHLYDLFPHRLVDAAQGGANVAGGRTPGVTSELREIPEGWKIATIDEEFNLTMGQSPPGETYNESGEGLPFFQGRADFGFRFPSPRVFCTAPTRYAEAGDTLVSVRAPVGDINMADTHCCIGRGVASVRHKTGSRSYTYYFMRSIEEVFDRFEAEGTVFGSISKKDFHNIQRIMPPGQVVNAFERLAAPIDDKIALNDRESRNLSRLRDTLLPKLISGELRVKNAERFIERGT